MEKDVKVDKTRELIDLKEISVEDLTEILRNKEIELYENEIELLDLKSYGLNLNELGEKETNYVFNFLDNEMSNPFNDKKTKNDLLNSFVMTFDNHEEISNLIWELRPFITGYDRDGNEIAEMRTYIKDFVLYRKWKSRSIKFWNDKNLDGYIDNFRDLIEGNLNRNDIIRDAIFNDSIRDDVSETFKMQNRRLFVDTSGMKNVRETSGINVFVSGGGREMASSIEEITGHTVDVTKYLDDED